MFVYYLTTTCCDIVHRLLSFVKNCNTPLFSPEQIKSVRYTFLSLLVVTPYADSGNLRRRL